MDALSTPVFKKKKPSSRANGASSEAADPSSPSAAGDVSFDMADLDQDDSPGAAIAAARAARIKKKKAGGTAGGSASKTKAKSKLSFGGDEEEDESSSSSFVPKKSALSRAISSHAPPTSSPLAAGSPSSSYSSAYLSELKASTPSRPSALSHQDAVSEGLSRETMLKYGIKPDAGDTFSAGLAHEGAPAIPTESAILAAKAKRSHLRSHPDEQEPSSASDFIALDGRSGAISIRDEGSIADLAGSRLIREEDETGDGEDEHAGYTGADERVPLGKRGKKEAKRREREGIREAIEDREVEEMDESEEEWEESQIRRANLWGSEIPKKTNEPKEPYRPAKIPDVLPLPTLSAASLRLSTALSNLTLAHAQSTHRINEISAEVGALDDQERELRKEVDRVETKREWAEGFRAWCETLGEFLEVKFPELEAVERENLDLLQERHSMVARRRMEDDADDIALCLGVPTEVDVATLQPYVALVPPSNPDEEEALSRLLSNLTLPPTANIRSSRRTTRLARLASSTTSPASTMTEPIESPLDQGYLTDAALPQSDESDYILARSALDARRMAVFDDVKAIEMKDPEAPGGLLERFDQWRVREGGEEYRMAWGGEALVTALEFWARWEVAGWDPLKSPETLDHFRFYTALHAYSRPKLPRQEDDSDDEMDDEPPLGSDGDLVLSIMTATILPRLTVVFGTPGVFDPYSSGQTRRAVDLLEQVESLFDGAPHAKFTALVNAVLAPFQHALGTLSTLLTLAHAGSPPPAFNPDAFAARLRFLGRLSKLVRNAAALRSWAREPVGQIVDGLVGLGQRLAESGWEDEQGGGKRWAEKLLATTPRGVLSEERELRLKSGPPRGW